MVGLQALEARLALAAQGLGAAVDHLAAEVGVHGHAALAGQQYLVALAGERLAHHPLVGGGAVQGGGIEVAIAHLEGLAQGAYCLGLGDRLAVAVGEVHATQADGGGGDGLEAVGHGIHGVSLWHELVHWRQRLRAMNWTTQPGPVWPRPSTTRRSHSRLSSMASSV